MTSRLFSSSTVYFLRQLLEEFHRGEIILPRFHRPLVWNAQRRLELFDSIRKGIPLGSFTIWETHAVDIPPMTEFGAYVLPQASKRTPHRYLIDGGQRLMTLYLNLYEVPQRDELSLDEVLEPFEVFFDLDQELFITSQEPIEDEPLREFPLHRVFDFRSTLHFQRELARHAKGDKLSRYLEHVDAVVQSLKECTIAVTTAVTDDLALATEVFKRVNGQGVPMSAAHLVNALTWQGSSSLFDAFDEVRESLEAYPHWQYEENLSNDLLLLVAKRLVDYDMDDDNIEQLAIAFRDPAIIERLEQSLQRTAAFLHERGLRNPAHVPDAWMLVMLAKVFDKVPKPSLQALDRLEDWIWCIAYTESLDSANRSATYQKLESLAFTFVDGKPVRLITPRYRRALHSFNFDTPRSKAFAWMLAQRMLEVDNGKAADALAEHGEHSLRRLSLRAPRSIPAMVGWHILWSPGDVEAFRFKIRQGKVARRIMRAQVIPEEALEKLREDPPDIKEFLRIREREINAVEEERFQEIMARLFPEPT